MKDKVPYIIEAHRWGAENEHHYTYASVTNKRQAIRIAKKVNIWRDGKYGVRVYQRIVKNDICVTVKEIAYFPSKLDEDKIYINYRLDQVMSLGSQLISLSEKKLNNLPRWLIREIKRIKNDTLT